MSLSDVKLYCNDCKQPYTFTIREQQFYASKNIVNPPSRCSACRAREKSRVDQTLYCSDCGQSFVFTKGEQKFYEQRNMTAPSRCQACRERKKALPKGNERNNVPGQPRQMYTAFCAQCGTQTQVPFQPKPGRPVYCRTCY